MVPKKNQLRFRKIDPNDTGHRNAEVGSVMVQVDSVSHFMTLLAKKSFEAIGCEELLMACVSSRMETSKTVTEP